MCNYKHTATHCKYVQHTATHCHTRATHCNTLQHTTTHYKHVQHTATRCNTLRARVSCAIKNTRQHTANTCNTLQHTATHCNTLQHAATRCGLLSHVQSKTHCNTLHTRATHCNMLQHAATCCNILQHTATHTLQHTAGYASCAIKNTLQHTTHTCKTLQHTATHSNTDAYDSTVLKTPRTVGPLHLVKLKPIFRSSTFHSTLHKMSNGNSWGYHSIFQTHKYPSIVRGAFRLSKTNCDKLQTRATHCNTLQHTATHTATHCNT